MRLIDADAMLEYLDLMYDKQDDWREPYNVGVLGAIYYIKHKASTVDVVKCAECIWRDKDNQGEDYCTYVKGLADINDESFCSWGERREP